MLDSKQWTPLESENQFSSAAARVHVVQHAAFAWARDPNRPNRLKTCKPMCDLSADSVNQDDTLMPVAVEVASDWRKVVCQKKGKLAVGRFKGSRGD